MNIATRDCLEFHNEYGSEHAETIRRTVIQEFCLPFLAAAMLHFLPVMVSFFRGKPNASYFAYFSQPSLKGSRL